MLHQGAVEAAKPLGQLRIHPTRRLADAIQTSPNCSMQKQHEAKPRGCAHF